MNRPPVQSFWFQDRLGRMERMCIGSFLHHGHPFHLYAYRRPEGLPPGAVYCDAAEILPADEVFVYRRGFGKGSPSAFSNYFRYKLLLDRGGWWTDMDAVLLRPLEFSEDHVVGLERSPDGGTHIAAGMIKAPAGSPVLSYCVGYCRAVDRKRLRWGQIGPRLLAEAVRSVRVPVRLVDPQCFYPIDYWDVEKLVETSRLPEDATAIHLWNSQWRQRGLNPDQFHRPDCIYEQLAARYGPHRWQPEVAAPGRPPLLAALLARFYAAKSSRAA